MNSGKSNRMKRNAIVLSLLAVSLMSGVCGKKGSGGTETPATPAAAWVTTADQSMLLQKKSTALSFTTTTNTDPTIEVDSATQYQSVDGFGFTLTGGSAQLIGKMDASSKAGILNEIFGSGDGSIGVSYLRLSIGASDLSASVFSYNDMPAGQTDPALANFNLSQDTQYLIPLLKEIMAINPKIKLMGSPWSPPTWMKDNGNSVGGSLLPAYYSVYAQYFVKYIKAMAGHGLIIDAVTIQNEPQHGGNNPSMVMSAPQQADFVKNHLGPAFKAAGINTKIIVWDHNCDNPNYPITIMNDAAAKAFIDGAAFHLYAGDITALSGVQAAHPDKNLYFTEQWTGKNGSFDGDLKWHIKNVVIGSMNNWSRIALEWNLANDPNYGPHTPGGCTECKGAFTINASISNKNVAYYIIGQISKFVPPGSVRIKSTVSSTYPNVAFVTPSGKKVMLVLNESNAPLKFNIKYKGQLLNTTQEANSVTTYVW